MSSIPCARPAATLLTALPAAASACVECRQAALSTVFSDGFFGMLLTLWMPVGLLLAAGLAIGLRRPPVSSRARGADGH